MKEKQNRLNIRKTRYHSYRKGRLSKGCALCVEGRKSVLFITGICGTDCYYCPISDVKKNKDIIYINEKPVSETKEEEILKQIIQEIKLCSSTGVGITGGDPLARLDRTVSVIKGLKKEFGKDFHIHLYTPLDLVDEKKLNMLYGAGLDEIRFHPDIDAKGKNNDTDKSWKQIELANKYSWDIGVEIPVVPGKEKEIRELIDFIEPHISFLNLNELEIADNSFSKLLDMGFRPKDNMSYAVSDSEELALLLMDYCKDKDFRVHYCTAKLKDKIQMAKRIMLRARNIAKPSDIITKDGMLLKGAVYLSELKPDAGYREKLTMLESSDKSRILDKLKAAYEKLSLIGIKPLEIDNDKLRLLSSAKTIRKSRNKIKNKGYLPAIVEEYPTFDSFEVEVEFL